MWVKQKETVCVIIPVGKTINQPCLGNLGMINLLI
jgi:hypothetical protein